MFAAWHAGLTVVPINAKLHQREFAYILDHAGAKVCFVTSDLVEIIGSLQSTLTQAMRVICVDDVEYNAMAVGPVDPDRGTSRR
jgi:long-chain acyl-CoA synthetase